MTFLPELPSFASFGLWTILVLSFYLLSGINFGKDK